MIKIVITMETVNYMYCKGGLMFPNSATRHAMQVMFNCDHFNNDDKSSLLVIMLTESVIPSEKHLGNMLGSRNT